MSKVCLESNYTGIKKLHFPSCHVSFCVQRDILRAAKTEDKTCTNASMPAISYSSVPLLFNMKANKQNCIPYVDLCYRVSTQQVSMFTDDWVYSTLAALAQAIPRRLVSRIMHVCLVPYGSPPGKPASWLQSYSKLAQVYPASEGSPELTYGDPTLDGCVKRFPKP